MLDTTAGNTASQWDDANIGLFSMALGENVEASGKAALATGYRTLASGDYATALGRMTQATAFQATAMGESTQATGAGSTATGSLTHAAGLYSLTGGLGTTAASRSEAVFGEFNTAYTPFGGTNSWDDRDRLFVIGNGVSGGERDALMVLKNGMTGIGTIGSPQARLHVANTAIDNTSGKHTLYITESNSLESPTFGLDTTKPYYGIGFRRAWNNNTMGNLTNLAGIYAFGVSGYKGGLVFKTENTFGNGEAPDVVAMVIRPDGNVGIGEPMPSYKLAVNGTAFAVGAAGALSDRRHKTDIADLSVDALGVVESLRPVSFRWKEPQDSGMEGIQVGLIAQEVESVLPEAVLTMANDEQTKGIKYNALIPVLIQAIQQQQKLIKGQKARIASLEESQSRMLATMKRLDSRIEMLAQAAGRK